VVTVRLHFFYKDALRNECRPVETGTVKRKDDKHLWILKNYADRTDNKLCAAAVIEEALVIKTLMTHWQEVGT
jgi:hypothetical protein